LANLFGSCGGFGIGRAIGFGPGARGFLIGGHALHGLRVKKFSDLRGVSGRDGSDRACSTGAHDTLL
jgi:hypothetical protein